MKNAPKGRWRVLPLLIAVLCSTSLPRAFVVCVSEGDHVSLEAAFEPDPCETNFVFGARALLVPGPAAHRPVTSPATATSREPIRHLTDWRGALRRPTSDQLTHRTTALRL